MTFLLRAYNLNFDQIHNEMYSITDNIQPFIEVFPEGKFAKIVACMSSWLNILYSNHVNWLTTRTKVKLERQSVSKKSFWEWNECNSSTYPMLFGDRHNVAEEKVKRWIIAKKGKRNGFEIYLSFAVQKVSLLPWINNLNHFGLFHFTDRTSFLQTFFSP